MADDWHEWLEYGKKDIKDAKERFAENDYGQAAYMTQQALEKHVKSIWITCGMAQPKELGHDIVGHIVGKIRKSLKEWKFGAKGLSKDEIEKMMETAEGIVKEMKRDGEMKSAFWKHSLGIETASVPECFKKYMPEVEKVVGKNGDAKRIMRVVAKRAKTRTAGRARGRALKDAKMRAKVFASTIDAVELLMKVFPHSTYGHYPYSVECDDGTKRSSDLYVEYKENLKSLIDEVEKACGKLAVTAAGLAKARKK